MKKYDNTYRLVVTQELEERCIMDNPVMEE